MNRFSCVSFLLGVLVVLVAWHFDRGETTLGYISLAVLVGTFVGTITDWQAANEKLDEASRYNFRTVSVLAFGITLVMAIIGTIMDHPW